MKKVLLIIILLLITSGCSVTSTTIYHDEDKAIDNSNLFIKALIKEDYSSAYNAFFSNRFKNEYKFEHINSDFKENRKVRGRIKKAVFDSFQAVPGKRAIQLYYNVTHERTGDILYHLVLEGDGKVGYKIILVDIGNQMQYPPDMKYVGLKRIEKEKYIEVTDE